MEKGGLVVEENINKTTENKKEQNKKIIGAVVLLILIFVIVVGLTLIGLRRVEDDGGYLTYENYMKIQTGMTYAEVVEIMGGEDGELNSSAAVMDYTLEYYIWQNEAGTKSIVIGF
jgi:hypothetical protein